MINKWQIITATIAIMAIIVPTYVVYDTSGIGDTPKAKLEVAELVQTNVSSLPSLEGRVQVHLDDKEIDPLNLAFFTVKNIGQAPVLPKDIYENITISAENGWRILGVSNINSKPDGIKLIWKETKDKKYALEPLLINPEDSFTVAVYSTNESTQKNEKDKAQYKWSARISNVQDISIFEPESFSLNLSGIVVLLSGWSLPFAIPAYPVDATAYQM